MSNTLLQEALNEFEKLSIDDQNTIAARWLEELKDEQLWTAKYSSTTDDQWNKIADLVKQEIADGEIMSLDSFLDNK